MGELGGRLLFGSGEPLEIVPGAAAAVAAGEDDNDVDEGKPTVKQSL